MPSASRAAIHSNVETHEAHAEVIAWARRQSLRPLRLLASVCLMVSTAVAIGWISQRMARPTRFDEDLALAKAPMKPEPWLPCFDPNAIESIDFEAVHAHLLPEWVIALHHDPYSVGSSREQRRFDALIAEAGKDPNLALLLRRLRDRATLGVSLHALEISQLLDGWNHTMQQAGLPWYVAYDSVESARGGRLYTRCYHVQADVLVPVGPQTHGVRLLSRVDSTNVAEAFFGQTSTEEQRALVVGDRVAEFALERLWPMMEPQLDAKCSEMDRAFAPALRHEASQWLSDDTLESLRQGAMLRHQLIERLQEIERKKGCGRWLAVDHVPWNGLSEKGRSIIARAAQVNERKRCDRLTHKDAQWLIGVSEALSSDEKLKDSLGQLAAWLARAVASHEVRHLADGVPGRVLTCDACPEGMSERAKAEVSAYVASFASKRTAFVALYQACGVEVPVSHGSGDALRFVLGVLMPQGCESPPPNNLVEQARLLDWILFKRVQPIEITDTFPKSVPLPKERTPPSLGFETVAQGQKRHSLRPAFPMRSL